MADADDVTIRHPSTLQQQRVRRRSLRFYPDWEVLDKAGRKAAHQPASSTSSTSSTAKPADTTTEE